jgi:D-beta-D-heptose 7-phosphate kinase/D-beta-D-heptose 1-phosphate adenosyltransferase
MDFSGLTVLCVGDVMLDRFIYGAMERISPEAPVPIVYRKRATEMLGGAGNVANNIVALGAKVVLVGLVGDDEAGRALSDQVALLPRATSDLIQSTTRPTTCKTRFIAASQQVMRFDEESRQPLTSTEEAALIAACLPRIDRVDAIILSDYNKGVLSPGLIAAIIGGAKNASIPVFVDPKTTDFTRYRGATCIKPNLHELALASGKEVTHEDALITVARKLLAVAEAQSLLVTRSAQGMTLVTAEGATSVAAKAREVFDVSGAGDTVIAALTLAYASGRSLTQAMHVANAAAGVVVSKLGTATASVSEVLHELAEADDAPNALAMPGLRTLDQARDLVTRWKQQGVSVGFTNGCFDVLHSGHVLALSHARSACDRLVVALNSDDSVSRLKGPSRPVNTLQLRARVVAALRDVDCVVSFEEDSPLEVIRTLIPDVLVKGADYQNKTVVGADFVIAMGGRVFLSPLLEGQSTTSLIAKIREPT